MKFLNLKKHYNINTLYLNEPTKQTFKAYQVIIATLFYGKTGTCL